MFYLKNSKTVATQHSHSSPLPPPPSPSPLVIVVVACKHLVQHHSAQQSVYGVVLHLIDANRQDCRCARVFVVVIVIVTGVDVAFVSHDAKITKNYLVRRVCAHTLYFCCKCGVWSVDSGCLFSFAHCVNIILFHFSFVRSFFLVCQQNKQCRIYLYM